MTKVNQTGDVQSLGTFGLSFAVNNAFAFAATETASASSSTSVTGSATGTHATNDAKGQLLVGNTSATWAGTTLYGVVQSNTSGTTPVHTVDRWYTLAGATSGSSPSTSGPYLILPVSAPFWFVALSDSVSAVSATDTGAAMGGTEFSTQGLARQIITSITRTAGSSITYTVSMATTFTYTGSTSQSIGRAALVNSLVASKNFAYFLDQINSGVAATVSSNGDTLAITYTITVG